MELETDGKDLGQGTKAEESETYWKGNKGPAVNKADNLHTANGKSGALHSGAPKDPKPAAIPSSMGSSRF